MINLISDAEDFSITADDMRLDLRIDDPSEDNYINSLIAAAYSYVGGKDGVVGKAITTQVYSVEVPCFTSSMYMPITPARTIDLIEYYDTENVLQTLDSSSYLLSGDDNTAIIDQTEGASIPSVYARRDAVKITFTCGYTTLPKNIERAIRILVTHWYENRGAAIVGASVVDLPFAVESLLNMSRKGWVA